MAKETYIKRSRIEGGGIKNNLHTGDEYEMDGSHYIVENDYDILIPNIKMYLSKAFKYDIFGHMVFLYQLSTEHIGTILPFIQCIFDCRDEANIKNGKFDYVENDIILRFGVGNELPVDNPVSTISIHIVYEASTKKFKMEIYEI